MALAQKTQSRRGTLISRVPTLPSVSNQANLPQIPLGKVTARTVEVSWSFPPGNTPTPAEAVFQIVKSEGNDPDFVFCYEGKGFSHVIDGLKPITHYRFKLRMWIPALRQFSKNFEEFEAVTIDEAEILRAEITMFKAVYDNNIETTLEILTKFPQISMESRDKSGRTFLMVFTDF